MYVRVGILWVAAFLAAAAPSAHGSLKYQRAWIFQNDRPNRHQRYMFKPVTDTLIEGLRAMGVPSLLTVTEHYRCDEECMQPQWLKPQQGDMFLWVGNPGNVKVPFAAIQARGVFTVFYQSEPRHACQFTAADGVDEVWDYSWHNIEACTRDLVARSGRTALVTRSRGSVVVAANASVASEMPSAGRQGTARFGTPSSGGGGGGGGSGSGGLSSGGRPPSNIADIVLSTVFATHSAATDALLSASSSSSSWVEGKPTVLRFVPPGLSNPLGTKDSTGRFVVPPLAQSGPHSSDEEDWTRRGRLQATTTKTPTGNGGKQQQQQQEPPSSLLQSFASSSSAPPPPPTAFTHASLPVRQGRSEGAVLVFFGSLDRWAKRAKCWRFLQSAPELAWEHGQDSAAAAPTFGTKGVQDHAWIEDRSSSSSSSGSDSNSSNALQVGGGVGSGDFLHSSSRLVAFYNVWTEAQFAAFARRPGVGVFLVINKGCLPPPPQASTSHGGSGSGSGSGGGSDIGSDSGGGGGGSAVTTVRLAQLLNAGALILSEKGNARDMAEYADLVSFVAVGDVPSEFKQLMQMGQEDRQKLADSRHLLFARRFHPKAIFERAGLVSGDGSGSGDGGFGGGGAGGERDHYNDSSSSNSSNSTQVRPERAELTREQKKQQRARDRLRKERLKEELASAV